jgi:hypothetical protein
MAKDYMLRVRLSAEDVRELDKRRGQLSRSEFVRTCIVGITAESTAPAARPLASERAHAKPLMKPGRKT